MTTPAPTAAVARMLLDEHSVVIACDEVGRGALAGPVAVGAVAVTAGDLETPVPDGLRDSKLVSARRRPDVARRAAAWVSASAVGYTQAGEIDEIGMTRALGVAVARAVTGLVDAGVVLTGAVLLLDGSHDYVTAAWDRPVPVVTRVKADRDCAAVSAASVIAKVARDALMVRLHEEAPAYDWVHNKGYASLTHRTAIGVHGLTRHHRASWDIHPVAPPQPLF